MKKLKACLYPVCQQVIPGGEPMLMILAYACMLILNRTGR